MANSISTSTSAAATAYPAGSLVAMASDGSALVVWFDGTNVKWSYAQSPYTSWTTATLISSLGAGPRWQAGLYNDMAAATPQVVLVTSDAAADMVSYVFTYNTSNHHWSVGSANTVVAASSEYNGGDVALDKDAQGRYWAAWQDNSATVHVVYSSNGTSWTSSTTISSTDGSGGGTLVGLAYIGNYIVVTYSTNAGNPYDYIRADAHTATIGSWSAAKEVTGEAIFAGTSMACLRGAPGSNYGVLATDDSDNGNLPATYYNASTDTWSSWTALGGNASDRHPTLVTDGTDLYLIWCKYAAASSYSLVYKKFTVSTQTWDASSTQLEASGSNIAYPTGNYGNSSLAFAYTQGTASPWTVYFDTKSFSGGGSVNGIATILALAGFGGGINASASLGGGIQGSSGTQARSAATPNQTLEGQAGLFSGLSGQGQVQASSAATPSLTLGGMAGFLMGLAGQGIVSAAGSLGGAIHGIATLLGMAGLFDGMSGQGMVYGSTTSLNQATITGAGSVSPGFLAGIGQVIAKSTAAVSSLLSGSAGLGTGQAGAGNLQGVSAATPRLTLGGSGALSGGLFAGLADFLASGGIQRFPPFRIAITAFHGLLNLLFATKAELSTVFAVKPRLSLAFQLEPPLAQPNSTIQVTATATDINGNPVSNMATVAVVVTFPDGTTQSFSLSSGVVNAGSGKYTITYTTKTPGPHLEDWQMVDPTGNKTEYHNITPVAY